MPNNCHCDQMGLGDPTQTCGDCPEDYKRAREWRWVDDKGRVMTNWKAGDPPPVLDLKDAKGEMHVEVRVNGRDPVRSKG